MELERGSDSAPESRSRAESADHCSICLPHNGRVETKVPSLSGAHCSGWPSPRCRLWLEPGWRGWTRRAPVREFPYWWIGKIRIASHAGQDFLADGTNRHGTGIPKAEPDSMEHGVYTVLNNLYCVRKRSALS